MGNIHIIVRIFLRIAYAEISIFLLRDSNNLSSGNSHSINIHFVFCSVLIFVLALWHRQTHTHKINSRVGSGNFRLLSILFDNLDYLKIIIHFEISIFQLKFYIFWIFPYLQKWFFLIFYCYIFYLRGFKCLQRMLFNPFFSLFSFSRTSTFYGS